MTDGEPNYEPQYFEAVAKVQSMFAGAPTPGEVVRAIERLGWAPREFVTAQVVAPVLALHRPVYPFIQTRANRAACSECRGPMGVWVEYPCPTAEACGSSSND